MHEVSNKTVMGFDFGYRRIGVAVGQTITGTARPLSILLAKEGIPAEWQQLDKIIAEWLPDILLVGLPLNMDGTEQDVTQGAKHFATLLAQRYQKPVETFDERLSTREARQRIFETEGYKGLQKKRVDNIAAQIIVESWLIERGRI